MLSGSLAKPQKPFKRPGPFLWFTFTFLSFGSLPLFYSQSLPIQTSPNCSLLEMIWTFLSGFTAFFVSLVVFQALRFLWRCAMSPLHQLPGPASTSWLYGNVREFTEAGQAVLWDHWTEIYGNTFKFSTFFNVSPCLLPSVAFGSGRVILVLTVFAFFLFIQGPCFVHHRYQSDGLHPYSPG